MNPRTARCSRIQQDLARTLAGLRSLDCEALAPGAEGAPALEDLRRLLDRGASAAEQLEQLYPQSDDLVVTTVFLRCAIDGVRRDFQGELDEPGVERVIEAVSSIEAGMSRVIEMFAQREGLRLSYFGPSELVRALRNRRSVSELDRLLRVRADSHSPEQRVRLVGTGLAKLIGSTAFPLLPIGPRQLLRTMRQRMHGLLLDGGSSRDTFDQALGDCAAMIAILLDTVNRELVPHDLEMIAGACAFIERGDLASAEYALHSLTPRSQKLAALLQAPSVAPAELLEVLEELRDQLVPPPASAQPPGEPFLDFELDA